MNQRTQSNTTVQKTPSATRLLYAGWVIFFLSFYVYIWKAVEPHLIYHSLGGIIKESPFSTGWLFFAEHWSRPSGPVEYMAGFLSQLYYFNWLGALVITLVSAFICIGTKILIRITSAGTSGTARCAPAAATWRRLPASTAGLRLPAAGVRAAATTTSAARSRSAAARRLLFAPRARDGIRQHLFRVGGAGRLA